MRWSSPDSWHITLQFLGNTTPDRIPCLTARLGEVRSAPVPIQLGKLGSFERAGVFFADVAVSTGLAELQERVIAATARCGFVAEARPFHPHITLARKTAAKGTSGRGDKAGSREQRDLVATAGTCRFSHFTACEFLLYESHLGAQGSRYEVLARFAFSERPH